MSRVTRAALAASVLWLAGCDSEEKEARKPWDGSYTPLEEKGDWQDTGAYSACKPLFMPRGSPCNPTPEAFDMSACRTETLAGLEREGIFRAIVRYEFRETETSRPSILTAQSGFQLGQDGAPVSFYGQAPTTWRLDDGTFYLTTDYEAGPDQQVTRTLVGCESPAPGVVVGCASTCSNGQQGRVGTFIAERMTWREGEPESSGPLKLLSESRVELGKAADVFVTKGHAYVVSLNRYGLAGGLTVFDVSDRRHPIFKSSFSFPGDDSWNGVWAKGDTLYVASDTTGVALFDISNPSEPVFLRYTPNVSSAHTVLVDGDRLYAMSTREGYVYVFDVSTPANPQRIGELRTVFFGEADGVTGGMPHDAFAYEGRLYINEIDGGLEVVDVNNLDAPQRLGRYDFLGTISHASAVGTMGGHTIAFEGGERFGAHVRVLLVDDPANIVKIGEFKLRGTTSVHNMILKDERLYVAWYHEGVRVLDVSNPTQPRQVAHYNTFRETDPRRRDDMFEGAIGMRVPGDGYVYAVDTSRGLLIFNEP